MPEFAAVIVIAVIIIAITAKRNELCEIEAGRYAGLSFLLEFDGKTTESGKENQGENNKKPHIKLLTNHTIRHIINIRVWNCVNF